MRLAGDTGDVRLVEQPHVHREAHLIGGPDASTTSVVTTTSGRDDRARSSALA
jgi:hypothetical protein